MPIILQSLAVGVTVTISFIIGTFADFSDYIVWMYEDPNAGTSVFSQTLRGDINDYYRKNIFLHKTAVSVTQSMTKEQKAGQLLMPAWEKNTSLDDFIAQAKEFQVGGIMVLRNDATVGQTTTIRNAIHQDINEVRLDALMSIDAEPSLMRFRIPSAGYKTNTDSLVTTELAKQAGEEIAGIIGAYGYNYNFAPVYDTGENKSIIGNRAFGNNTDTISTRAGAFTSGLTENNIIATAKHFPGHGSVIGDTHKNLQTISGDLPELDAFRSAIQERVPSIMVGHLAVNGGMYDTQNKPATISKTIITDLLRNELEYKGIVVTDAMVMGALDEFDNPDMSAIIAGADIVLMPRDLAGTHKKLVEQMQADELFEQKINEHVYRIVRMKLVHQWSKERSISQ